MNKREKEETEERKEESIRGNIQEE